MASIALLLSSSRDRPRGAIGIACFDAERPPLDDSVSGVAVADDDVFVSMVHYMLLLFRYSFMWRNHRS